MATDPWADFNPTPAPTQQQPVRQSSPPPFIPGTPKPPPQPTPPNAVTIASEDRQRANDTWTTLSPEQAQQAGLGPGVWQQNGMGQVKQVSKGNPTSSTGDSAEKVRQLRVALENLDSIEREVNGAMFGQGVGNIAGTEGFQRIPVLGQRSANISGGLDMVQGDLINQVRLQMAEQGVVVGASHANTEKEAARLAASIANLAQTQDEANFLRGLQNARQFYLERLKALGVEEPAAQNSAGAPLASSGQDSMSPGKYYTPEDRELLSKMRAAYKAGATLEQLQGISAEYGRQFPIPTQEALDRARQEGRDVMVAPSGLVEVGQDSPPASPTPPTGDNPPPQSALELFGAGVGDLVQGVGDTAGIIVNPVGQMVYNATGYGDQTYDLGQILRDASGLPDSQNEFATTVNKFGAGAMTGGTIARGIASLANPGTTQAVAQTIGRTPIRDTVAGAAAGAGSYAGRESGIPGGEIAGALAGGMVGYGGANALMNAFSPRELNAVAAAAGRQGVDLLPADVGGTGSRMATGAVGKTLGGIPLAEASENALAGASRAKDRVASKIGQIADETGAGQAAQRGAQKFIKGSMGRAIELYEQVPVPPDQLVKLENTRAALTEVTRGFRSNPELSRLWANYPRLRATLEALTPKDVSESGRKAFMAASETLTQAQNKYDLMRNAVNTTPSALSAVRQEIEAAKIAVQRANREAGRAPIGGELSWEDMSRFRTIVGEIIGQPGIKSDGSDIASLRKLYAALSSDMEQTASATSPRALALFRRATQYWRGREDRIDNVLSGILGPDGDKGGLAAYEQINRWAQQRGGDFAKLAKVFRSMPEDEADLVRGTLFQRLGVASPARQNPDGLAFSPAEFSTQWQRLDKRAKAVLFPSKQYRQDIEDIVLIADNMKRATAYSNFSNTSLGVNTLTQGALALTNLPVAVALAGMQFGGGKLLASPRFARIIASTAKLPPEAQNRRLTEQLGILAKSEPLIANDIKAVQQFLSDAMSQSPTRAAAEGQNENNGGSVPPQ